MLEELAIKKYKKQLIWGIICLIAVLGFLIIVGIADTFIKKSNSSYYTLIGFLTLIFISILIVGVVLTTRGIIKLSKAKKAYRLAHPGVVKRPTQPTGVNKLAVIALIFSLPGIFIIVAFIVGYFRPSVLFELWSFISPIFLLLILSFILGIISLKQIKKYNQLGRQIAIVSIYLSIIPFLVMLGIILLMFIVFIIGCGGVFNAPPGGC